MSIQRKELKIMAKAAIHDNKPSPIWITLVYILISYVLQILVSSVSGELEAIADMVQQIAATGSFEEVLPETTVFGNILSVVMQVMGMVLAVGFSLMCLNASRRGEVSFGTLFDGFGMILRTLSLYILRYFIIMCYSMVYAIVAAMLMVPLGTWGLVVSLPLMILPMSAMYSLRQAVFLMIDYRHLSAMQCLALSRKVMKGHCWELFVLDLSFLGWDLLCVIPFVGLWVQPYQEITNAGYYDRLMEQSGRRPEPAPPAGEDTPQN